MNSIELEDLSKRNAIADTERKPDGLQELSALRDAESVAYWAYTAAGV